MAQSEHTPPPPPLRLRLQDAVARCGWFALLGLTRVLPVSWTLAGGQLLGRLLFRLWSGKARALERDARRMLEHERALSDAECRALAREALCLGVVRKVEFLVRGRMTPADLERLVRLEGLEHLDAALAEGRGVILLTAHFGHYVRGPHALGARGYRVNQLTGVPTANPHLSLPTQAPQLKLGQDIARFRDADARNIPVNFIQIKGTLKTCLKLLRQGELLIIAFDGRVTEDMLPARVFGKEYRFAPGAFRMARSNNSLVLPFFVHSPPGEQDVARIEAPLDLPLGPDGELDLQAAVQAFATVFERHIREHPGQALLTYNGKGGWGESEA